MKIQTLSKLYSILPESQRIIVDILREIVRENIPEYIKEKISYSVPYFYGNKGLCIIWPSAIPRGGIKSGVLFGFWHGNLLEDQNNYLKRGTNKQIYYKIYQNAEDIEIEQLIMLLNEALLVDENWR